MDLYALGILETKNWNNTDYPKLTWWVYFSHIRLVKQTFIIYCLYIKLKFRKVKYLSWMACITAMLTMASGLSDSILWLLPCLLLLVQINNPLSRLLSLILTMTATFTASPKELCRMFAGGLRGSKYRINFSYPCLPFIRDLWVLKSNLVTADTCWQLLDI